MGKVANVFPGYPDAVTTDEEALAAGPVGMVISPLENPGGTSTVGVGIPFVVQNMLRDPDLPDELRLELLRAGFIELAGPGLRGPARYIHGDQVAEVSDDVVRLRPG